MRSDGAAHAGVDQTAMVRPAAVQHQHRLARAELAEVNVPRADLNGAGARRDLGAVHGVPPGVFSDVLV